MITAVISKQSPWRARVRLLHHDYRMHPSRAWEVASVDVPIPAGASARTVTQLACRAVEAALLEPLAQAAVLSVGEQLELW